MSARRGFALPLIIAILFSIVILVAWSPWVTPNFAYKRIKATIKPPCEEFKPNLSSQFLGVAPPPYHKFIFGTEYFIPVDCHLSDVPNGNSYFVSFLGTIHKLSSTPNSSWGVRVTATTPDETTNWNPFTNPQKTFTLMLPPNWKQTSTFSDPFYRKFFFSGPEGTLEVLYGSGLGGGCDNWSKIQIMTQSINACYLTEADNSESIGASTVYQDQGFSISAKINAPYKENEKIIKDIFASIDLIGTEKFN